MSFSAGSSADVRKTRRCTARAGRTTRRWPRDREFQAGLARLTETAARQRVAVMCSEADPLDCHRCLLVGRALAGAGFEIGHILASGEIITHGAVEDRLLQLEHLAEADLLMGSRAERLAEAYRAHARKAAYVMPR